MSKLSVSLTHRFAAAPSGAGLILGALFWIAALTPSLIPREGLMQGAIAGLAFAVGYGLAAGSAALWVWLGLPAAKAKPLRRVRWLAVARQHHSLSLSRLIRFLRISPSQVQISNGFVRQSSVADSKRQTGQRCN